MDFKLCNSTIISFTLKKSYALNQLEEKKRKHKGSNYIHLVLSTDDVNFDGRYPKNVT